ncbi:MAG: glutamine--fructose-6-phosphate transaminase (isomerizing) [DPANN group archaeon]|nr:glutamine--fructose-6-phosphate transaminase (isomerizing) [DPANN group archaeon]
MCGIFAYIGGREATPILLQALRRLEYRGYDSAGISVKNYELKVVKTEGKIRTLEELVAKETVSGKIGIAHTRWATHGEPTTVNAHPHMSCDGKLALVHNGVIENYLELKFLLEKKGHNFVSNTDTEVLVHLIEEFENQDLTTAVELALSRVEGAYGLVIMSKNEDKIIGAKKGSSLVLGVGKDEYFLASDTSPIIEHTRDIIHLEDEDIVIITKNSYKIKNFGKEKIRPIEKVDWDIETLEKKGYDYFMLKEIYEQPESLKSCLRGRIEKNKTDIHLRRLELSEKYIKNISRIILLACGTSWHAGLVGKYILEEHLRIPVEVDYASEFRYRNPIIKPTDLVIAISQSGETADTLAALKEAKNRGAETLGIVNVVGSAIAREAGKGIYLHAGPEIGVASTKAFTSQIIALHLLNLYFGRTRNTISDEKAYELIKAIEVIPEKVKTTLELDEKIKEVAEEYYQVKNFLYLGRGINFPVALEGALKLKEISYIHAEGYPAAEMKHGPIALIDKNMPVVFIANKSNGTYEKVLSNMEEVKARKGRIIAIATEEDNIINKLSNHTIYVPNTIEFCTSIINTIPLQLLAYHIAVLNGRDVDKPRNLAKSVTVE